MAISTTQSIWRSGGGDQTRQSYCGSGVMAATFWIPAAGSSANVQASSTNTSTVILPAGAVITSVLINDTGSGAIDLGYVVLSNSTAVTDGILNGATATAIATVNAGGSGSGTAMGTVMAASSNIRITSADGGSGSGNVGGVITYFVTDPLAGQQNV